MQPFSFATTHSIISEVASSLRLADIAKGLGITKLYLVTDPGILNSGILNPVLDKLEQDGLPTTVYSEVKADPPESVILSALEQARSTNCNGVVGFGGGSAMDTAKLVALLMFMALATPRVNAYLSFKFQRQREQAQK